MKAIRLTNAAAKAFRKLPTKVQGQINGKLNAFVAGESADVTKLTDRTGLRLRSGDFRVIFEETATEIVVTAIGNRRDIYR